MMHSEASTDPFALLAEVDRQYRAQRASADGNGPAQEEWIGVLFRVGSDRLLAPMPTLAEILPPPEVVRVPGVKPWLLGIANLHGVLVPVVDLQAFLTGEPLTGSDSAWRLLVATDGNQKYGLLVNEVFGMKHYWPGDELQALPEISTQVAPFVATSYKRYGEHFAVFDLNRLLSHPGFNDTAR